MECYIAAGSTEDPDKYYEKDFLPNIFSPHLMVTVGIDYKITPGAYRMGTVEIGGSSCGINGAQGLYKERPDLHAFRSRAIDLLDKHLDGGGDGYEILADSQWETRVADSLTRNTILKDTVKHLVYSGHTQSVNDLLDDKVKAAPFIPPQYSPPRRIWVPPYWYSNASNRGHALPSTAAHRFVDDFIRSCCTSSHPLTNMVTHPFIVIKSAQGMKGEGVNIFSLKSGQRTQRLSDYISDNLFTTSVIEAFIPSVSIKSTVTGKWHDACGRFLIDYYVDRRRLFQEGSAAVFTPIFQATYLRLSPLPLDANGGRFHKNKYKANFTGKRPALPEPLPEQYQELVTRSCREIAESILPILPFTEMELWNYYDDQKNLAPKT